MTQAREAFVCRCWQPWPLASPARRADIARPWRVYAAPDAWHCYRLVARLATLDGALSHAKRYGVVEIDDTLPTH